MVARTAEQNLPLLAQGPGCALYAVLDAIVDGFMPILETYQAEMEDLESAVFAAQWKRSTLRRLYGMQRERTSCPR